MALIFAVASVGQTISTRWIGSSNTGWHCGNPSLTPLRAADDLFVKLEAAAAWQRLDLQHDIAELAVAAGLLLVPPALGDRLADGLLISDRRRLRFDVDAEA